MTVCSDLAEEDGHAVVVEEEGLWKAWVVELEEEGGEAQSDILLRRDTEGWTKQLHPSHRDEQSTATKETDKGYHITVQVWKSKVWDHIENLGYKNFQNNRVTSASVKLHSTLGLREILRILEDRSY